jgi:hypothetical protein
LKKAYQKTAKKFLQIFEKTTSAMLQEKFSKA